MWRHVTLAALALCAATGARAQSATVQSVELAGRLTEPTRAALLQQLRPLQGKAIDVAQARALAQRLTALLRDMGYPVGMAVLSDADARALASGGVLRLHVFEGEVGKVVVSNTSGVSSERIVRTVEQALCGEVSLPCVITTQGMERAKLLLDDLPGITLHPFSLSGQGVGQGQTALAVKVTGDKPAWSGRASADNYGAHSTGSNRFGLTADASNWLGEGDLWRIGVTSTNRQQNTGFIDVYLPVGYQGLRLHANLTQTAYTVDTTRTKGDVTRGELGLAYPVVRGFDQNWNLSLDLFHGQAKQTVLGAQAAKPSKQTGLRWGLTGDAGERSKVQWGNFWTGGAVLTTGRNEQDGADPAPNNQGSYAKLNLSASGRALIDNDWFVLGSLKTQNASRNLNASEGLVVGGVGAVRAYGPSAGLVMQGLLVSAEVRYRIDPAWFGLDASNRVTTGLWLDALNGWAVRHTYASWDTNTLGYSGAGNHRFMAGYGLALDWSNDTNTALSLTAGRPLAGSQQVSPTVKHANLILLSLSQGF